MERKEYSPPHNYVNRSQNDEEHFGHSRINATDSDLIVKGFSFEMDITTGRLRSDPPITKDSKFIILGDDRVKISNIKNYGISTYENKRYTPGIHGGMSFFDEMKSHLTERRRMRYLYITTYQGDNMRYDEDKVDIDRKAKELDSVLT